MYKYLILTLLLFISCKQDSTTYISKINKEIILPNSASSWYTVKIDSTIFRGKELRLLKGSLDIESVNINNPVDIDILKDIKVEKIKWQASASASNQQLLSTSFSNFSVIVNVNDSLSFMLNKLDLKSAYKLVGVQEGFVSKMWEIINTNKEISAMHKELLKEKGEVKYVNANAVLDWLTSIYVYDGPSLHHKYSDSTSVYLTGYVKGNKAQNLWLDLNKVDKEYEIVLNARLSNRKTNETISEAKVTIDPNIELFWSQIWTTHDEFIIFWKEVYPNKPIPSILLDDAGIVVNTALIGSDWGSDILTGSNEERIIIIRSNIFNLAFPPGQVIGGVFGNPM